MKITDLISIGCGVAGAPSVFSEVATVLDWIHNVTKGCYVGNHDHCRLNTCAKKSIYKPKPWMWQFIADLTYKTQDIINL